MLVFYYNLKNNKVPSYLTSFLPNTSIARERYPIRYPRLQPPICSHECISKPVNIVFCFAQFNK